MANIFLSYPYTGQELNTLSEILTNVTTTLEKEGHTVFCALLRKNELDNLGLNSYEERLAYCLAQQQKADTVLAILLSDIPSNGMKQELILAKEMKQKYLLLIQKGYDFSEYRSYAEKIREYSQETELHQIAVELF